MVWVENEKLPAGEFHSLLMFATAGMMFMASAGDLVIVFLGLEILSIATYVMAGFRRTDVRSNESSLKYFILGSLASAFLLYGIALIYGATATTAGLPGTTNIAEIARRLNDSQYPPLLFAGAAMMLGRLWLQDRNCAISHLDSRCLRRRADSRYCLHGGRDQKPPASHHSCASSFSLFRSLLPPEIKRSLEKSITPG